MATAEVRRKSGRSAAIMSIIIGVLWIALGVVVSRVGHIIVPDPGTPRMDDTAGISHMYIHLTPAIIVFGIALSGLSFALIRRLTTLMLIGAFINATMIVWLELIFRIAIKARVG